MKLCDRCSVPGCCLDYLGGACEAARKEYCPDVKPARMEIMQKMEIDELSVYLANNFCHGYGADKISDWLKQPAEVE